MRYRAILALLFAALLPLALASCEGNPAAPPQRPEDRLVFLRAAPGAPSLATDQVTFRVTQEGGGEGEIRYSTGYDCLRFRVPGDALLRKPDGTPYLRGESVMITVRVVDPTLFKFEFSPAGIVFDPRRPAELRISYKYADRDFDGDGLIDEDDRDFEFGVWKQERDGELWQRIGTAVLKDLEEVRAEINGFTKYAVAGE